MAGKNKYPPTVVLIQKLSPKFGLKFDLEKKFGFAGQLTNKHGKKFYFKNTTIDVNGCASSEIARDKSYTNYFLKKSGIKVPKEKPFFSQHWCQINKTKNDIDSAISYAKGLKFPLIIKPNSKGQGEGVFKVYNLDQLAKITKRLFRDNNIILIQEFLEGDDYRVVVFKDKIYAAYKRIPLFISGDGKSTIEKLLEQKLLCIKANGREVKIDINDSRIKYRLKYFYNKNKNFISKNGEKIFLLDNANLSTGGEAIDITDSIAENYKNLAIKTANISGLLLAGVDMIIDKKGVATVVEVNSSPGLTHFLQSGDKSSNRVKDLYSDILHFLSTKKGW